MSQAVDDVGGTGADSVPFTGLGEVTRAFSRDRVALVALSVVAIGALLAVAAPILPLTDPYEISPNRLVGPLEHGHLLGTDEVGRDILSRLIWGARTSLLIPVLPVLGTLIVGTALGLLAGYRGGVTDAIIMRGVDVLLAFPGVLLAIAVAAAMGPGLLSVLVAIAIVETPTFVRLVRAVILGLRNSQFVEAAKSLGATDWWVMRRHLLPQAVPIVIVYGTLGFGRVIILASTLSFLGLGVQLPAPDWGAMLDEGRRLVILAPHVATIPGVAIFVVALAVNLLGDSLRDALDPRLQ